MKTESTNRRTKIEDTYCKAPCENCPFRKDSMSGWLGEEKMKEIVNQDSFVCHKFLDGGMEGRKQCAGHMILNGNDNAFVRTAKNFKIELGLKGQELIFSTRDEAINHHKYLTTKQQTNGSTIN